MTTAANSGAAKASVHGDGIYGMVTWVSFECELSCPTPSSLKVAVPIALAISPYDPPWMVERYTLKLAIFGFVLNFQDKETECGTGCTGTLLGK